MPDEDNGMILIAIAAVAGFIWYNKEEKKPTPQTTQGVSVRLTTKDLLDRQSAAINPSFRGHNPDINPTVEGIQKVFHNSYADLPAIMEHVPLESSQAPNILGNSTEPPKPEEKKLSKYEQIAIIDEKARTKPPQFYRINVEDSKIRSTEDPLLMTKKAYEQMRDEFKGLRDDLKKIREGPHGDEL